MTPDSPQPAPRPFHSFPLLAQVRGRLTADAFTPAQRVSTVRQMTALIDGIYAHLWQKRAMHLVDPVARLRALQRELPDLTDAQFQARLQRIMVELRDLHTRYTLPRPYRGGASIGLLIERCWEGETPQWIVSKVANELGVGDATLAPGVEVTYWNGSPIAVAVARNADREAGSNAAARSARGLQSMTQRILAQSPIPDEDWVDLVYRTSVGGQVQDHSVRLPWRVVDASQWLPVAEESALRGTGATDLGLDLETDLVQRLKKALFAPAVTQARPVGADASQPIVNGSGGDPDGLDTTRKHELRARTVHTAHGVFGHLRLFTFLITDDPDIDNDIDAYLKEVQRLLRLLPQNGLIIDVRDNGGGHVFAAESLLQYLTPRRIEPSPLQLIATDATADLCANVEELDKWRDSVDVAIATGSQYSAALPLYPPATINSVGQIYPGPVVLITDAFSYSATDTFAALFQDHKIGKVIGVDNHTGAGGANVWELDTLLTKWPGAPVEPLPRGASMRIAIRRTLRVGDRSGEPIEDLGVQPDIHYRLTKRDLLQGNVDLMDKAAELLADGRPGISAVTVVSHDADAVTLFLDDQEDHQTRRLPGRSVDGLDPRAGRGTHPQPDPSHRRPARAL